MKNFLRHSLLLAVMLWGALASAQGGGGSTVTFDTYDSNGNLLKVSEGGKSIQRTYDRQNRVLSYTDSAGNQIGYRYYGSGKLAKRIYPGGTENGLGHVEYTYWATGQLKEVIDRLSSVESPRVTTFYWDEGGSLTRVVRPNGTERQISYDFAGRPEIVREVAADGRLIKLFKNQYFPSDQLQSLYQLPYGKGQQETPLAKSVYGAVGSMEYNADNQLVRFEGENVVHDLDGNMVYGPLPGGVMSGYSYDSRNRLLSSGGLSYSYDPEGERIGAGGNGDAIHYVNEVNHGLSQVLRRTKNGAETTYVWGIGLLYEVGADGEAVYYHYDNVGSTIALSNEAGVAIERMEYEPYGTLVHRAREAGYEGALHDTAYLFAGFYGYQTDSSGLVYLRERYYNPLTRRFINPDPAREGWNWYAYAGGDPLGFVDPSGLGAESVLDAIQTGLSALGMMPIVGAAFDILNAGISFVSGQHVAALMNLASAVPGIGDAFAAGKMAFAGAKVAAASLGAGMAAFGKVGGGVKSFRAARTPASFFRNTRFEVEALQRQGLSRSEAFAQIRRFNAGNADGFAFHFTNPGGAAGILDDGAVNSGFGIAGRGVYAGTTPTPSALLKYSPTPGWALTPTKPVRIPLRISPELNPMRPVIPFRTQVFRVDQVPLNP